MNNITRLQRAASQELPHLKQFRPYDYAELLSCRFGTSGYPATQAVIWQFAHYMRRNGHRAEAARLIEHFCAVDCAKVVAE